MKVAVVGSGSAGLAATWALNEHSEHEVHLFEADSRVGGHVNTVPIVKPGKADVNVDTGFIVLNPVTYPNLLRFFDEAEIPCIPTDMSFAVSRDLGGFEWAGGSFGAIFAQRSNLLDLSHWRMVWDIIRFSTAAVDILQYGGNGESIGDFLRRERYSHAFRDNYLLPMTAAIWSTPPDAAALDFPVLTLIRFMHNHHLLQLFGRPHWLTVKGGAKTYVDRIVSRLPDNRLHLSTPISAASSSGGKIRLRTASGGEEEFDHVVFACHADTTLRILEEGGDVTPEEREILQNFQFSKNRAILHSDKQLMPKRRIAWSAWNYLTFTDGSKANVNKVSLTYWMNALQSLPEELHGLLAVTLNPPFEPRKDAVIGEWEYEHPLFSQKSIEAQDRLPTIQNKRAVTFAGAWAKYGFHEDGFKSGLDVAVKHLGARIPFEIKAAERDLPISKTFAIARVIIGAIEKVRKTLDFF